MHISNNKLGFEASKSAHDLEYTASKMAHNDKKCIISSYCEILENKVYSNPSNMNFKSTGLCSHTLLHPQN